MHGQPISPLRQRMLDAMAVRNLAEKTRHELHPSRQELCVVSWPRAR